jgi:hypothetical protein
MIAVDDRVRLASGDNVPPELRNQLLEMAREWMHAVIDEEDAEINLPPEYASYEA